jgi:hypothetical protein
VEERKGGVREMQELCASYIGLREEPRGRGEAVAW